jgi:Spy/CpxP family protein refolding chaperone
MNPSLKISTLSRSVATVALALVLTGPALAQDGGNGPQRPDGPPSPERILEHMQQELGLSASQSTQVKQILEQERAQHDAAHQAAQQALAKVLTPEQLQKMQERRPRGAQGARGQGGYGPGAGGSRSNDGMRPEMN